MRHLQLFFMALFALFVACSGVAPAQAAGTGGVAVGAIATVQPQTNAEIRQWYNDQVAVIPALDETWIKDGVGVEERARRAQDIRHHARLQARAFMPDKREVADLQARDQEKYGNPDGPDFDYLVQKNREKGLTGAAVYEDIIGSANRTNKAYNDKFGVTPAAKTP